MHSKFINPLVFLFPRTRHSDLAQQLQYLKVENEILRARMPKHIRTTKSERKRLLKFGKPLGPKLAALTTIVEYETFQGWERQDRIRRKKHIVKKRGRPPVSEDLEATVLRMAQENHWGYPRIHGEIRKLRFNVSRSTIRNILKRHGLYPCPPRGDEHWTNFLKRHAQTFWACDFLSKKIWTRCGLLECFVLFFIHTGSRRVYVSGVSVAPDEQWVCQQARNFRMHLDDLGQGKAILIRDGDAKFTDHFDDTLKKMNVTPVKLPPWSPDLNAYAERWVKSVKEECLNHFIVFGVAHLDHLVTEYAKFYNTYRPHRSKGNLPLAEIAISPPLEGPPKASEVKCKEFLGGWLKHYYRRSA